MRLVLVAAKGLPTAVVVVVKVDFGDTHLEKGWRSPQSISRLNKMITILKPFFLLFINHTEKTIGSRITVEFGGFVGGAKSL